VDVLDAFVFCDYGKCDLQKNKKLGELNSHCLGVQLDMGYLAMVRIGD
jgi:hypothetical protein